MEENNLKKNNIFQNSKFSRNVRDLFSYEFTQYYNKNRLNTRLKSIISKEKTLNNRKIKDFDYGKMFHLFKVDMRKFEEEQNKHKNFYKTLYEENLKFNQDYTKSYSSKIQSNNISNSDNNIKSKTFQKFYNKHKVKLEQNMKKVNNFFNRDPLLDSSLGINLFYLNKKIDNDYLLNDNDDALNYITKLEEDINENSVLNKIKYILHQNRRSKEKKLNLNSEEESDEEEEENFYKNNYNKTMESKMYRNTNRKIKKRKTIISIKKYNRNLQDKIDKLNSYYSKNQKSSNKIYNLKKEIFKNNNINNTTRKKSIKQISSNQIENLYNEIIRIKNNLKKYEKRNENELNYLYTAFSKSNGKKFKLSYDENKKIYSMDKKLIHTVNSFND